MARTVKVSLTADVGGFKRGLREAGSSLRDFRGELDKAARGGQLDAVADQAASMGLALVAAGGAAIKLRADFEKAMSGVKAATRANAADLKRLEDAALAAGKSTQYSATEAANAITEMAKAGVSATDILGGGLNGALSLAAAGQMEVAEAAETAASAMVQFRLKGADLPHIADLLAAGAGKAQGSVADLGQALNQSGLIAAQTGLTIEDTTGALAAFANAGLLGSDAGTSFKTMLQALAAPSGVTRDLMDDLGISAYNAQGQFIGITALAQQLRDKLGGLTQAQRDHAMAQIFGSDAVRAANILYREGSSGIQEWIGKVDDAGFAAETARIQTDNLVGDLERLKGSLETLAIEAGGGANAGLRVLTQSAEALVDQFGELPPAVGGTATVLAVLGGGLALGAAGWVKMRRSNAEALEELRNTGPAGQKAARGLEVTSKWAGRAAAAFVAFQAAQAAISAFQSDLNPQLEALAQGLTRYANGSNLAGEASRLLGTDLDKLDGQFKLLADESGKSEWARSLQGGLEGLIPGLKGTDTSLARTKERVSSLDGALAQLVQGGKAGEAKQAFDRLAEALAVNGVSMDEFRKQFPQYASALEVARGANTEAAGAVDGLSGALDEGQQEQKEYKTTADAAADAVRGERDALAQLGEHLRAETDPVFGLLTAQEKLAEAQKAAAKATKEHGKNSVEAKTAQRELALAAIELETQTGKLGDSFDGKMTPALRATLKAAGVTDKEIKGLEAQFAEAKKEGDKFAKKYAADVTLSGYGKVEGDLEKLVVMQQALKKGIPVSAAQSAYDKNSKSFHGGGHTGPGAKYDVAGVVHADEFVVRKESRARFEKQNPGALDYLNRYGELPLPGYATGGMVWPFDTTVAGTRIPSRAEVSAAVTPDFGSWPSSPSAQRGDSGIWRSIVSLIRGTGPMSGEFGNGYRPGDPKWHGSGRAVDWTGYNQDGLASFLASKRPLELIHRTKNRDYAYTRGVNKGSFNEALMEAHRNHVHIAMKDGGVIGEHIVGVGRSGATYEFGEAGPERVTPMRGYADGGLVGRPAIPAGPSYVSLVPQETTKTITRKVKFVPTGTRLDTLESYLRAKDAIASLSAELKENGRVWDANTQKGRDNRQALISSIRAARDAAEAKYAETGNVKAANVVWSNHLAMINTAMKKRGVSAKQRKALLNQYKVKPEYDLPGTETETITIPGKPAPTSGSERRQETTDRIAVMKQLKQLRANFAWQKPTFDMATEAGQFELDTLFSYLDAAEKAATTTYSITKSVKSASQLYNGYMNDLRGALRMSGVSNGEASKLLSAYGRLVLEPISNRWGGVYERATGGLRTAQIAAGGPTRYAWAEAKTGGEAFIPRLGDKARSTAIWQHVGEKWLNQPVWRPGSSGAAARPQPITVQATIPITLGAEVITRQVEIVVDAALGQVVNATVYQTS